MTLLQVQRRLINLGYLPLGAATDRFDQRTLAAVIAFQKWKGSCGTASRGLRPRPRCSLRSA